MRPASSVSEFESLARDERPAVRSERRLGARLVEAGKLLARDLERALAAQRETGGLIGQVLVRLGLASELDVFTAVSAQLNLRLVLSDVLPSAPPFPDGVARIFQAPPRLPDRAQPRRFDRRDGGAKRVVRPGRLFRDISAASTTPADGASVRGNSWFARPLNIRPETFL